MVVQLCTLCLLVVQLCSLCLFKYWLYNSVHCLFVVQICTLCYWLQPFDTTYQMRQYRRYSQSALVDAVTAVQNHSMTVNRASRTFKVPRSTIQIRLLKLSGKKTWGSRSEQQPGPGGSSQSLGNETVAEARGQQEDVTMTDDQHQSNSTSSLPND